MPTKPTPAKPPRGPKARLKPAAPKPATVDVPPAGEAAAGAGKMAPRRGGAVVKLKDLIDQVTEASGAKKKDVKPIVEATLARLGAVLGRGETLSLQGFGHLRVARKATAETPVMTLKLRLVEAGKAPSKTVEEDEKDTLAEDSDQG